MNLTYIPVPSFAKPCSQATGSSPAMSTGETSTRF